MWVGLSTAIACTPSADPPAPSTSVSTSVGAGGGDGGAGGFPAAGGGGASPSWHSELYPSDWTPDYETSDGHRVHDVSYAGYKNGTAPIGVPVVTTLFDVTTHGAVADGSSDATAAVQDAIDAASAAGGGVVYFPAGSYRFEGQLVISTSKVVLRGAGQDASQLFFTSFSGFDYQSHILFRATPEVTLDVPLAENGAAYGNTVVVSDASSVSVGDDVVIGWVISDEFVSEHDMVGTWDQDNNAFHLTWQPFFRRQVLAIDGNVVTLDVPLRYPALTRDTASLRVETGALEECGVEALSLGNAVAWDEAWSVNQVHALEFDGCQDCWIRNVASFDPPTAASEGNGADDHLQSGGLLIRRSKRVTVADSSMHGAQNKGPGGNGYLFEVRQSGEILFRDLEATAGRHNYIQNWGFGVSGCVWLRVASADANAWLNENQLGLTGMSEFHHSLAMANLIDSSRFDDGWAIVNRGEYSSHAGHTGTQNIMWNTRGDGVLRSRQFGWGYVVGTDAIKVQVDPTTPFGGGEDTEPEDWVEGVEQGPTLAPPSLYEDQLQRRLR